MSLRMSLVAMAVLIAGAAASAQQMDNMILPARFTAFAVSIGGPRSTGVATQVEITIDRWSLSEESQRLLEVLKAKGPEQLLDALRDMKSVGSIRTPGNLAYDLRYASQEPLGDGMRQITLATDRPISFWEAVNQPRTINYPFTFIELRINGKGEGEGKLALATKIDISRNGKTIVMENYQAQPINLNEVRRQSSR